MSSWNPGQVKEGTEHLEKYTVPKYQYLEYIQYQRTIEYLIESMKAGIFQKEWVPSQFQEI